MQTWPASGLGSLTVRLAKDTTSLSSPVMHAQHSIHCIACSHQSYVQTSASDSTALIEVLQNPSGIEFLKGQEWPHVLCAQEDAKPLLNVLCVVVEEVRNETMSTLL